VGWGDEAVGPEGSLAMMPFFNLNKTSVEIRLNDEFNPVL
jgi:hypothetical protein